VTRGDVTSGVSFRFPAPRLGFRRFAKASPNPATIGRPYGEEVDGEAVDEEDVAQVDLRVLSARSFRGEECDVLLQ
jgi:hypothetical protein